MRSTLISQRRELIAMSLTLSLTACYPTHGVKSELAASDVAKLADVATIAVDDLPSPRYAAVIADINTCSPKK